MSTDWNVYCKTCDETHRFCDANHEVKLMRALVKHASSIVGLAPLLADPNAYGIEFRCYYGPIDPEWFKRHTGHELIPISEYGDLDDEVTSG